MSLSTRARCLGAWAALGLVACAGSSPDEDTPPGPPTAPPSQPVSVDPCDDLDGDGVPGCSGDCNDRDPWISPTRPERCDGIDDDCDDRIDEAFDQLGQACGGGIGACAFSGVLTCTSDGLGVTCDGVAALPTDEVRNRIDDNCNGEVDEGLSGTCKAGETVGCGTDAGVCAAGRSTCDGGVFGPCDGQGPRDELCNGLDDDCNGLIDDMPTDVGSACGGGSACETGRWTCIGGDRICAAESAPSDEVCNGGDDDCDGRTDEGVRNRCGECGVEPAERCDGVDDDCDERIDEGAPGEGAAICFEYLAEVVGFDARAELGRAVVVVDDVDDDGYADVLVGAPGPDRESSPPEADDPVGELYLLSGRTGDPLVAVRGDGGAFERGAALATADVDGDGRREWIVGAPGHRSGGNEFGRVDLLDPRGFEVVASIEGQDVGTRFGTSVAALSAAGGEPGKIFVGAPHHDANDEGRIAAYHIERQPPDFVVQWQLLPQNMPTDLGRRVVVGPPASDGPEAALYMPRFSPNGPDTELIVLDPLRGDPVRTLGPPEPTDRTFGLGLAGGPAHVAVGAWSADGEAEGPRGAAWLVEPRFGNAQGELRGDAGDRLGFSVAVLPGLRARDVAAFCAGAVTDAYARAPARPGYVACAAQDGEPLFTVEGSNAGDAFGASLAVGPNTDPDGRVLLVVGAPYTSNEAERAGAVGLIRIPIPR